jgi:hypothetical protein
MEIVMTKLWAKLFDTDGDGNVEAIQFSDDDPITLFTPEACQYWHEVPLGTAQGDVLEKTTGTWWKGADWLEKRISESAPPVENPVIVPYVFPGGVLAVEIVSPGSNYMEESVRDQYDIEDPSGNPENRAFGLVLEVKFDPETEGAISTIIHQGGQKYQVGQTFTVKNGRDLINWDRRNPTWCVIRITEVQE